MIESTPTAMRAAFEKAVASPTANRASRQLVRSALARKVGLLRRKTMWSVRRGGRR